MVSYQKLSDVTEKMREVFELSHMENLSQLASNEKNNI